MSRIDAELGDPERHPDDDLLADLAAEVLPARSADPLLAHVRGCGRCASRLADAEGIRALLRRESPQQMPADVLVRIEAALAVAARTGGPMAVDAATAVIGTGAASAAPSRDSRASRASRDSKDAGAGAGARVGQDVGEGRRRASPAAVPVATAGVGSGRGSTGPPGRRRSSAEGRGPARRATWLAGRPLQIAAAVLALGAVGSLAWVSGLVPHRGSTAADSTPTAAGAAAGGPVPAAAAGRIVLASGTDYTAASLPDQARRLLGNEQYAIAAEANGADTGSSSVPRAADSPPLTPQASTVPRRSGQGGNPTAPASTMTGPVNASGNQTLRDSDPTLQGCLAALGVGAAAPGPVVVDLARYSGRDAVVVVAPRPAGGYDVWVVGRDCTAGNVHLLARTSIPQ